MRTAAIFGGYLLLALVPVGAAAQASTEALPSSPTPAKASPFAHPERIPVATADFDPLASLTPEQRCDESAAKQKSETGSHQGGVDFTMYMSQMANITRGNWRPLMPKEVDKPFYKSGIARVCFAVLPSGKVEEKSIFLRSSAGDPALDRAAVGAIEIGVYPPLPKDYKGSRLYVEFDFQYNTDRRPDPRKNLPPPPGIPGPIAVTVGYTSKL